MMKTLRYLTVIATGLIWLTVVTPVSAQEAVATGEHWTTASVQEKRAFLLGMGTIIDLEQEFQGANPPKAVSEHSLIPKFAEGLKGYTIPTAQQAIDAWYAANPGQLKRSVIEVIWYELTVPNLVSR